MKSLSPGDEIFPPWNSNKNSRFVELVLVVDTRLYIQFGRNQNSLHNMCKQIANKINSIYLSLDIYIALVGIVIWRDYDQVTTGPHIWIPEIDYYLKMSSHAQM